MSACLNHLQRLVPGPPPVDKATNGPRVDRHRPAALLVLLAAMATVAACGDEGAGNADLELDVGGNFDAGTIDSADAATDSGGDDPDPEEEEYYCPPVNNLRDDPEADRDGDGLYDHDPLCDPCPGDPINDPDQDGVCTIGPDGLPEDICPYTYNPSQSVEFRIVYDDEEHRNITSVSLGQCSCELKPVGNTGPDCASYHQVEPPLSEKELTTLDSIKVFEYPDRYTVEVTSKPEAVCSGVRLSINFVRTDNVFIDRHRYQLMPQNLAPGEVASLDIPKTSMPDDFFLYHVSAQTWEGPPEANGSGFPTTIGTIVAANIDDWYYDEYVNTDGFVCPAP